MVQKSQKTIEIPQVQHIDNVVDFPAVQVVQTVQKTLEIPVEIPMTQRQVPAVQVAQKTVKDPQTQSINKVKRIPVAPSMSTVVDVLVVAQHQEPTVHSANKKGRSLVTDSN